MLATIDAVVREASLFAAAGFLVGGIDDLAVDTLYLGHRWRRRGRADPVLDTLPQPRAPHRFAIFVAAWDESAVIARMLAHTLAVLDHPRWTLFVGTYPNDAATIAAVAGIAADDPRVRLVIGRVPGPTTKADCLNTSWQAAIDDAARTGEPFDAVVLHDAEDVVHPGELRVFDALIGTHAAVQLPVLPLVDSDSRLVAGHYLDEFAESHAKTLVARQALGAGLPLAGVGCAIRVATLVAIARRRGGLPFDADSLTEDYELGLEVARSGGTSCIAWVRERPGGAPVAVRAFFPGTIDAAVRQKARWMTGIALAGWDRVGWSRAGDWREHWMRMRDRRAPVAVLILLAAYAALVGWGGSALLHRAIGTTPAPVPALLGWVLIGNGALLGWRLIVRAAFTGRAYGWGEAARSVPRMVVGNYIALLAARRAAASYWRMLRGGATRWDKTAHAFPEAVPKAIDVPR